MLSSKESLSHEKIKSFVDICFHNRSNHFSIFLEKTPSIDEIAILKNEIQTDIQLAIFDLDGTLVDPYGDISPEIITYLQTYIQNEIQVIIYSNAPDSSRFDIFRKNNIPVSETEISKPNIAGFLETCQQMNIQPEHTAFIGNFPLTDLPLSQNPVFPLNILVKSIPPKYNSLGLFRYIRAYSFHVLAKILEYIVLYKHPHLQKK
ncbi:MAG: HAD hydrolase family protein [Candidatus Gracilibacteria bacterium]|nr:HAD hydrolase family protein [Candidatus Gracilibacteria bacterium]